MQVDALRLGSSGSSGEAQVCSADPEYCRSGYSTSTGSAVGSPGAAGAVAAGQAGSAADLAGSAAGQAGSAADRDGSAAGPVCQDVERSASPDCCCPAHRTDDCLPH